MRLLVYAPNAAGVFDQSIDQPFGGMETVAKTLADALGRRSDVDVIVAVESLQWPAIRTVEGVRVGNRPNRPAQLAAEFGRTTGGGGGERPIRRIFRRAAIAAELAVRRLAGPRPPASEPDDWFASLGCEWHLTSGASRQSLGMIRSVERSALRVASDADLAPPAADRQTPYGEPSVVSAEAVRSADVVFVQTTRQQQLLADHFARDGVLLPNPIDPEPWLAVRDREPTADVLWVGRADRFHKRPHLALDAAASTPRLSWRFVMPRGTDATLQRELDERIAALPNVALQSAVPFAEMPSLMAGCRTLCVTGSPDFEGLPNVLLQAALCGRPVVSLGAGEAFLAASGAGTVVTDATAMADELRRLCEGPTPREAGREYVVAHHSADAFAAKLVETLVSA